MKKIALSSIMLACLACICSCGGKDSASASGFFEATEITVSSEATGRILDLDIAEGETVREGETVGAVDSLQLYYTKIQLQKNSKSISSNRPDVNVQLSALESQRKQLENEKERISRLVAAQAVPSKQLDDVQASLDQVEKQIKAQRQMLQNNVNSIDAQSSAVDIQIAAVEDQLSKCRLTAPVSGTVLVQYAHKGEFTTVGKPLYKIADLSEMTFRAYVTSAQLAEVRIGQKVKVEAIYGGGVTEEYDGTVSAIASKSEFTPKNIPTDGERADMVYAVKIRVPNDGSLKIGTYGKAKF